MIFPGMIFPGMIFQSMILQGTILPAFFFFSFFGLPLVLYFLPTIIALIRGKRDTLAIFFLNFFLGWSVIGWFVALIWAAKHDVPVVVR